MLPYFWSREAGAAGRSAMRLGFALAETAVASAKVIEQRMPILKAAAANPLAADHREIGLMVAEKVDAFSQAGMTLGRAALAAQADLAVQWASLMTGTLSPAKMHKAQLRGARTAGRGLAAAGKALAPIHKAATANAKRLDPKKKKPRKR